MRKREKPIERNCEQCTKPFMVWVAFIVRGKGRFCSRECHLASCRVQVTCAWCNKEFSKQRACSSRYVNKKDFCSLTCMYEARKIPGKLTRKREKYGNSQFLKARKLIIERDGVCQICENTNANSVHHIDWNAFNNELINLVLLCRSCHGRFKHFEDFHAARIRIMACSELTSNRKSAAEMIAPTEMCVTESAAVS